MKQHKENTPDWLKGEKAAAPVIANKPVETLKKIDAVIDKRSARTLKGFRIREDYQERFDILVAKAKHTEGKKEPDLMGEALEMLFRKYDKKYTSYYYKITTIQHINILSN